MSAARNSADGPFPETPLEALGPVVRDHVIVEGRTFLIAHPQEGDMLDHPAVRSVFAADDYLPFWVDLWPAARMLAKVIVREPWDPGLEALEVGCGLGLPGIAALSRGLRVVFSDYDATALQFAADNARLNGFDDFRLLRLDWRGPPRDLSVPVMLASDLLFEQRNIAPLVGLIQKVLRPDGLCLLTDQERVPAHLIHQALEDAGLAFTTQMVRAGEPGGRRLKGTLYRIRHR